MKSYRQMTAPELRAHIADLKVRIGSAEHGTHKRILIQDLFRIRKFLLGALTCDTAPKHEPA